MCPDGGYIYKENCLSVCPKDTVINGRSCVDCEAGKKAPEGSNSCYGNSQLLLSLCNTINHVLS